MAPVLETTVGHLIDTDPNNMEADILDIWTHIAKADRAQAARVLRSFVCTGNTRKNKLL